MLIVDDLIVAKTGLSFLVRAVVPTIGTFLGSRTHIGLENSQGGRAGDLTVGDRLRNDQAVRRALRFGFKPLH